MSGRARTDLCTRFHIPRQYPDRPFDYYGDALARFQGIIGHAMVRQDKGDPAPDPRLRDSLVSLASAKPIPVVSTATTGTAGLTSLGLEELFDQNMRCLNAMAVGAGSLVKALLIELERRRTSLRLHDPAPGAHSIKYSVVQGDRHQLRQIARALGFSNVTEDLLELRHA